MAGGMPLAFTQEDFLVLIFFGKFPVISLSGEMNIQNPCFPGFSLCRGNPAFDLLFCRTNHLLRPHFLKIYYQTSLSAINPILIH